jgi:hypothetical protein
VKPTTNRVEELAGINRGLELTALLLTALLAVSVLSKADGPKPGRAVAAGEGLRRVEKVDRNQKALSEIDEILRDMALHDGSVLRLGATNARPDRRYSFQH